MVTEASQQVYGKDSRNGYIRAKIKSRHLTPAYRSKQSRGQDFAKGGGGFFGSLIQLQMNLTQIFFSLELD